MLSAGSGNRKICPLYSNSLQELELSENVDVTLERAAVVGLLSLGQLLGIEVPAAVVGFGDRNFSVLDLLNDGNMASSPAGNGTETRLLAVVVVAFALVVAVPLIGIAHAEFRLLLQDLIGAAVGIGGAVRHAVATLIICILARIVGVILRGSGARIEVYNGIHRVRSVLCVGAEHGSGHQHAADEDQGREHEAQDFSEGGLLGS